MDSTVVVIVVVKDKCCHKFHSYLNVTVELNLEHFCVMACMFIVHSTPYCLYCSYLMDQIDANLGTIIWIPLNIIQPRTLD